MSKPITRFEGEERFALSVDQLYAKLSDASFLVSCLDDVKELVEADSDHAVWKAKPPMSFIAGTLEIRLDFLERVPNASTRVRMVSRGVGSSSTVETVNTLVQGDEGGCKVVWVAELTELTGLLKMVPKSLLNSAAEKVIRGTWEGIHRKVKSEES